MLLPAGRPVFTHPPEMLGCASSASIEHPHRPNYRGFSYKTSVLRNRDLSELVTTPAFIRSDQDPELNRINPSLPPNLRR
jgi:hypothetical protein